MKIPVSSLGALLAIALCAKLAAAEPKDREATELDKQAMDGDYLGTQFKQAERKLQQALKLCAKQRCAGAVRARLHLDLAIVYVAGLKQTDEGKKQMQAAIAADASVQLNPDFSTPQVEKIFVAAGGEPAKKAAAPEQSADEDQPKAAPSAEAEGEAEGGDKGSLLNWFSLSFQQDFLSYKQTNGACSGATQFQCFLAGQSFQGPTDPIFAGSGNQVQGGLGLATKRVLLGYDRLLGENITLGARLGFAFGGSPKATKAINGSGAALLPFHAEARGSYWFGAAPFAKDGLRGYAGLALGLGEVDGHVTVEYYADQAGYSANAKGKLDAWRQTGPGFVGVHGGLAYAFSKQQQLFLELRLLQMLGQSALGGAVSLGYGFGL